MTEVSSYTLDAYRAANQLRMAARSALEWIGMFKGPAEISELLPGNVPLLDAVVMI